MAPETVAAISNLAPQWVVYVAVALGAAAASFLVRKGILTGKQVQALRRAGPIAEIDAALVDGRSLSLLSASVDGLANTLRDLAGRREAHGDRMGETLREMTREINELRDETRLLRQEISRHSP